MCSTTVLAATFPICFSHVDPRRAWDSVAEIISEVVQGADSSLIEMSRPTRYLSISMHSTRERTLLKDLPDFHESCLHLCCEMEHLSRAVRHIRRSVTKSYLFRNKAPGSHLEPDSDTFFSNRFLLGSQRISLLMNSSQWQSAASDYC